MNDSDLNRRQSGQSIVLVAVILAALIVFAAIAVDTSNAYVHRRTAQNGADAAALAGARKLSWELNNHYYDAGKVKTEMNSFAEQNGIADTDGIAGNSVNGNVVGYWLRADGSRLSNTPISSVMGAPVPSDARGIEAVAHSTAPGFFSRMIGTNAMPVQAEAAVALQGTCGDSCVVPVATYTMDFSAGGCYNIWNGDGPGNFGWLNWSLQGQNCAQGPCSTPCLEDNLNPALCRSGLITVGDDVAGTVGVSNSSKIRKQLQWYVDTQTPFTVVVWATNNDGQGCGKPGSGLYYRVAGFAKMQLKGYQLSQGQEYPKGYDFITKPYACTTMGEAPNNGNRLTATFIEWVEGTPGNCDPSGSIVTPRLIR